MKACVKETHTHAMTADPHASLSARERQVIDAVYQLGEATADDVRECIPDPPTNATVRSTLRVLEDKGWLQHRRDAGRYLYRAVGTRERTGSQILGHIVRTFFEDSPSEVVASLLDRRGARLDHEERQRIRELLERLERSEHER